MKSSAEFTLPKGAATVNTSGRGSMQPDHQRRMSSLFLDSKQDTLPIKKSSTRIENRVQQTD